MFWYVFCIVIGFFLGGIFSVIFLKRRNEKSKVGTIRVDTSEGSPYLFLELEQGGMKTIETSEYVTLRVNLKNYISQ